MQRKRVHDTNKRLENKHPWDGLVVEVIDVDKKSRETRIRIPGSSVTVWIKTRKLENI